MVWVIVVAWDRIFNQGLLDFCNDASIGSTAQRMYRALVWREIRFRALGTTGCRKDPREKIEVIGLAVAREKPQRAKPSALRYRAFAI
jgi:hypothetical protein